MFYEQYLFSVGYSLYRAFADYIQFSRKLYINQKSAIYSLQSNCIWFAGRVITQYVGTVFVYAIVKIRVKHTMVVLKLRKKRIKI